MRSFLGTFIPAGTEKSSAWPRLRHFSRKAPLKICCKWNYLRPIHHIEVRRPNLDDLTMMRNALPKLLNSA